MNLFWTTLNIGFRILILALAVIGGMVFILANAKAALAASLKDVVIITENTLKLGDLFDDIGENADYVLGPAPQPGQDMVLNAQTLYRIAVAMELPWRPEHSDQQVTIRRAATVVSFDAVEDRLKDKLNDEGVHGDYTMTITAGKEDIVLPHTEDSTIDISSFNYDPQTDIFHAVVVSPSTSNPLKQFPVSGKIERLVDVPVLKTALRNGDIIGMTDIEWIKIAEGKIQHDMILDENDLVNMTPRRAATAGKPILDTELERPQIVERGETITILYANGPMVLSAKGKALQGGGMGDVIRIANLSSSKTLEGIISNTREVTVK